MLLRDIKDIFHQELDPIYAKEEVDSFFYWSVEHYLGLERFVLVLQPNLNIDKEEEQSLFEALSQLKLQKPIQYVLGKALFMDLELEVNENVLIPRPETEELVQWVLDDCQFERSRERADTKYLNILDIGTGSGCIAIALAKKLPNANVFAMDISKEALEVAQLNAKKNQVDVKFIQEDVLNPDIELNLELVLNPKPEHQPIFDIIISNPPYVTFSEKSGIKNNVLDFEPHLALFVPDDDAQLFYKSIITLAKRNLKKDGGIYLEVNQYLGEDTTNLLKAHNFSEIELRKDIFGNHRMVKATNT